MKRDWLLRWLALPIGPSQRREDAASAFSAGLDARGAGLVESGAAAVALRSEPWDSERFGFRAGKLELLACLDAAAGLEVVRTAVARARDAGLVHLACRVDSRDYPACGALAAAGFYLVDSVVTLSLERGAAIPAPRVPIRRAVEADAAQLERLSAETFSTRGDSYNRYLNDPNLPVEAVRRVYGHWARTSIGGPAADLTLVTCEADALTGFLTLKLPSEGVARVPLNAVDRRWRGRGLYSDLVRAGVREAFAAGADRVEVVTQLQQSAVQRAWHRLGAAPAGSAFSWHAWLGAGARAVPASAL